jgi:hypothetical protein
MKHIYSKKIELSIYYIYDDNKQKKVYDLKGLKQDFRDWIKKLKSRK